jgi:hypothetical protein
MMDERKSFGIEYELYNLKASLSREYSADVSLLREKDGG